MNDHELSLWPDALILKVHIITGWMIPTGEKLNILTDQFQKKLIEDYGNLNTEEIEYAFRKSGTTIKDWGKEMNLNLLDQVLIPYLEKRIEASENEEKRKKPPVQHILTETEMDNITRGEIETAFQAMKRGHLPLIFDSFTEILTKDGLLREGENISEFFVRNLNEQTPNIYINESK